MVAAIARHDGYIGANASIEPVTARVSERIFAGFGLPYSYETKRALHNLFSSGMWNTVSTFHLSYGIPCL